MASSERITAPEENRAPVVSVIIPVYNTEEYLRECLESAAVQTLRDIEIICVNDGSTDASPEILREYAARDSRFRIIDRENGGLSEARNTGVRAAGGRYLYFLDSDDVLVADAMERCAENMDRRGLEYLCFNAVAFGKETAYAKRAGTLNRKCFKRTLDEQTQFTGPELLEDHWNSGRYICPVWTCMISRRAFLECGLWFRAGILHEDELWTPMVLMRISRAGCLNRVLYRYRIRGGSITNSGNSFAEAYGFFVCALEMERMLPDADNAGKTVRIQVERMLKRAVQVYCGLSETERAGRAGLNAEERLLFDMSVVYPARQLCNADAERKKLSDKCARLDQEKNGLKRKIKELKASRSYRLGRAVAKPYRMLKNALSENHKKPAVPVNRCAIADPAVGSRAKKPAWLLGTPEHYNLGDHCIAMEEILFLQEVLPDHTVTEVTDGELRRNAEFVFSKIVSGQPVFLHGGGNLGTLWPEQEEIRETVLRRLRGRQVVVFPQSILFDDGENGKKALENAKKIYRGKSVVLCCRDAVSFAFAKEHFGCRMLLVPDMVMREARTPGRMTERFGAMTLMRRDKERILTDIDRERIEEVLAARFGSVEVSDMIASGSRIGPQNREKMIDGLIGKLVTAECVVTDRLHGMVLCAVTGTPCVVLKNGYHKVEACHEWIGDLGYVRFIRDIGELVPAIDAVCGCPDREYPEERMRERFEPLIRQVRSMWY